MDVQKDRTPPKASTDPNLAEKAGLEEIVRLTNKIGLEYAEAKKNYDRLELLKPTVRARISMRLDDGDLSETKLRRLTETDEEYVAYLERLVEARSESEKLKIRYDSYKNLFDARRSLLSYQKAELKLL
jgi:hypothetical protein